MPLRNSLKAAKRKNELENELDKRQDLKTVIDIQVFAKDKFSIDLPAADANRYIAKRNAPKTSSNFSIFPSDRIPQKETPEEYRTRMEGEKAYRKLGREAPNIE